VSTRRHARSGRLNFTPSTAASSQVLNKPNGLTTTTASAWISTDSTEIRRLNRWQPTQRDRWNRRSIDDTRHLRITSDSSNQTFSFATIRVGAGGIGLNTFFSGKTPRIAVNSVVSAIRQVRRSQGGIGEDSHNAECCTAAHDELARRMANRWPCCTTNDDDVAQGSSVARAWRRATARFKALSYGSTGDQRVSIDEEAVRMIGYQRTFQASQTHFHISELLDTLISCNACRSIPSTTAPATSCENAADLELRGLSGLLRLQTQLSTGRRIQVASEDPTELCGPRAAAIVGAQARTRRTFHEPVVSGRPTLPSAT